MTRLAILGPAPPDRGGIARETSLLAGALAGRAGVDLRWWTFSRPYPRWLDPRRFDRDPSLPGTSAEPILDYASPASWKRTAQAVAAHRTDALLTPWWTAFWALPLRGVLRTVRRLSPATRRVLLCHNVDEHEGGALRRFLAVGAFLASDAFVCQSEEDRAFLARRAPGRPTLVAPHPVLRAASTPSRAEARRQLEIEGPLVLFLGLVRRYKGVDLLLEAAPEIVRSTGARIADRRRGLSGRPRHAPARRRRAPSRDRIRVHDAYVSEEEMDAVARRLRRRGPAVPGDLGQRDRGARDRRGATDGGIGGRRARGHGRAGRHGRALRSG